MHNIITERWFNIYDYVQHIVKRIIKLSKYNNDEKNPFPLSFLPPFPLSNFTQGGESHDLFLLFCTCIRIEWVRKLFSTSLILNKFSCGELQIPCRKQQMTIEVFYVMCCSFLHNLELRLKVFAQDCVEKYSVHSNSS